MVRDWTGDAAGDEPELRVWDVHAGEFIGEHRFDEYAMIDGLDVAPDGETLLVSVGRPGRRTSYNGHKVWVWDEEVWLWRWEARTVRPRSSRVRSVMTPNRRIMSVQCANPAPGARLHRVLFSPDADLVAVHRKEIRPLNNWPQIRHYDEIDILEPSGQLQATIVPPDPLREHTRGQTDGMAFSPDGQQLATTTLFDDVPQELGLVVRVELRLWDVHSGEELAQQSVVDRAVSRRGSLGAGPGTVLAFSPDGSLIASDGVDHTIQLWDAETLEPVRRLGEIRQDLLTTLAFLPGQQAADCDRLSEKKPWLREPVCCCGRSRPARSSCILMKTSRTSTRLSFRPTADGC